MVCDYWAYLFHYTSHYRSTLVHSHNISNKWKNHFSQLLNVHRVSDVRQIEVHTAEPLVPDPSTLEPEIAISKLRKYKSPAEVIEPEVKYYGLRSIISLIIFGIRKNYYPPAHADSSLAEFSTLKMEALHFSEMSVHTRSTRRHIPEYGILHSHRRENLKSCNISIYC
jgi:hypothetical protein